MNLNVCFVIVTLSVLVCNIYSMKRIYYIEPEGKHNSLIETTNKLFDTFYKNRVSLLVILFQGSYSFSVSDDVTAYIHNSSSTPILTIDMSREETSSELYSQDLTDMEGLGFTEGLIYLVDELDDTVWTSLDNISLNSFWKPDARFTIVVNSIVPTDINKFRRELYRTWEELHILNLVIIHICNPFYQDIYTREINTNRSCIYVFNQFQKNGKYFSKYNSDIFRDKLNNIYKEEINIVELEHMSHLKSNSLKYELKPIETFVKKINGSLKTHPYDENYTRFDIYGNAFVRYLGNDKVSSYPYDVHCLELLLPKSHQLPQYLNIILPFTQGTWLVILFTCPILVALWKVLKLDFHFELKTTIEIIRIHLSGSTTFPTIQTSERMFVMLCLLYSLLIVNSYTGSLSSYLTSPHYYPDISSLEELAKSDLFIMLPTANFKSGSRFMAVLEENLDFKDPVTMSLIQKFIFENSSEHIYESIAFNRNVSTCHAGRYLKGVQQLLKYRLEGQPLLHVTDKCFVNILIVHEFTYYSPFIGKFNSIVSRLIQGGFYDKWISDDSFELNVANNKLFSSFKPLNLEHVKIPFYIVCVGLFICSCVFVLEVISTRIHILFHIIGR